MTRRLPIGAEPQPGGSTHFRVWAPKRSRLEVLLDSGDAFPLDREEGGYHSGMVPVAAGALYRYRLDGQDAFPDPASRFQPNGPHGPSQVIDPDAFQWTDGEWRGLTQRGQVLYELHVGAFTQEGTWDSARGRLQHLAELGVTAVEVMPVADFSGKFGWGYDGVGQFAPVAIYGAPDAFRQFVNEAHRLGIGVILDVVYNHVGPDGNYLTQYSEYYFTDRYKNEWGEAINFEGPNSQPVREWVISNAVYWVTEYHLDGLRLDATQQIFDASDDHIITALTRAAREAAGGRGILITAENESQHCRLARPPADGGYGVDVLWNDDFHHTARVAASGHKEAYYTDYCGSPQEFISAAKYGYLFQGQLYKWQSKRRGTPAWGLEPQQFLLYLQNHDQVANSGRGERLHQISSAGRVKALTALMLLMPGTPMLFQGQEFAASSPFLFFADHDERLRELVREGRLQFLAQFPSLAQPEIRDCQADPGDPATFQQCKLKWSELESNQTWFRLHRDLLRLRRDDPVFRSQRHGSVDGAVLAAEAFVLRFLAEDRQDRLLFINMGRDLELNPAPEPLLAPPEDRIWQLLWSSLAIDYGGCGTAPLETAAGWRIPGHAAIVMSPTEPENPWET